MALVVGQGDQKLIEKWDQNLNVCQQERLTFEKQWYENLAFFNGRQWIKAQAGINGQGFVLTEQPSSDRWRVRHTANRILRIIRTEVTKLTKEEPQFFCMPASTEESDRLAAMAGDAISDFLLRAKYFNRRRLEATFWTCICGTGFLKNWYDPNKLEIDGLPGKIDFEATTPFHLFVPNLQVTEMELQPYVIHARTVTPEAVWNSYQVELKPGTSSANLNDARFLSAIGLRNAKDAANKQCYIKEVYIKPCKDFPQGAMFTYGENKLLYIHEELPETEFPAVSESPLEVSEPGLTSPPVGNLGPVGTTSSENEPDPQIQEPEKVLAESDYQHSYPYRHGRFPFVKIDHIPSGMFYGSSVIESLISPQKEYNRTRSIMLENRNLAGKPQWAYTPGSIDPRKFNSRPGLLLAVHIGFEAPQPLAQPPLPPNVTNELEVTLRDMDDISSQYEITKGRTPPGVEAASAIAYLSEENDTILYHTVQSLENAVQETGIQVLANVHDYWSEDRIVRLTSRNQFMEVREFKATDLNPIMDFRVESGSMAPKSLAAKQAFITELMKMGLPMEKAMRYLQMSETDKLYEDMMRDNRQAQRENVYMSKGQQLLKPIPPDPAMMKQMAQAAQNPEMMTPEMAMQMQQMMQPQYRTDTMIDPMTGQDQIGPEGQPVTYQVTINPYDAHEVHVEEHQNFQKSQEYELLDPSIQKIIQDHVDEHKMELLKERNAIQADAIANPQDGGSDPAEDETVNPREVDSGPVGSQLQPA